MTSVCKGIPLSFSVLFADKAPLGELSETTVWSFWFPTVSLNGSFISVLCICFARTFVWSSVLPPVIPKEDNKYLNLVLSQNVSYLHYLHVGAAWNITIVSNYEDNRIDNGNGWCVKETTTLPKSTLQSKATISFSTQREKIPHLELHLAPKENAYQFSEVGATLDFKTYK